jgi:hypothetical protein
MVETAAKQGSFEQVPPKAPVVDQVAIEKRRAPEPRQEAPEQSVATLST